MRLAGAQGFQTPAVGPETGLGTGCGSPDARRASRQVACLLPDDDHSLRLVPDDNRHVMIAITPGALCLSVDVLTQLGQGRAVTLVPQRAEITTQEAADCLNVSRPFVVALMNSRSCRRERLAPAAAWPLKTGSASTSQTAPGAARRWTNWRASTRNSGSEPTAPARRPPH